MQKGRGERLCRETGEERERKGKGGGAYVARTLEDPLPCLLRFILKKP